MKTKFRDLNWISKIGIIGGWVALAVYGLSFLFGFFIGILEIY